jgi:hypothetical protein
MAVRLSALHTSSTLLPRNIIFLLLSKPQGLVRPERSGKLKEKKLIWYRRRDFLVCSMVPKPLRYRVPILIHIIDDIVINLVSVAYWNYLSCIHCMRETLG